MSYAGVNLAARPFVNRRPVRRVAVLLWLLGGILLLANAALYWNHFRGQGDKRERLAVLEDSVAAEGRRVTELEDELEAIDLAWQNHQVAYLNRRIAERTFSWSRLFDRLAEVLPADVRLERLSPDPIDPGSRGARRLGLDPSEHERVRLDLSGAAKDGPALLELVDALFAHPAFEQPSPSREGQLRGGEIGFVMTVVHLPQAGGEGGAEPTTAAAEPPAPEPGGGAGVEVAEEPVAPGRARSEGGREGAAPAAAAPTEDDAERTAAAADRLLREAAGAADAAEADAGAAAPGEGER